MAGYAVLALMYKHLKLPGKILDIYRTTVGQATFKFCFTVVNKFDPNEPIDTPLIVSNHVTWNDIIYYGSMLKTRVGFVAKKQIASMFIIK
jgi:1-acyl-sn-glycerol-3-phosphate acyltransferase